MAMAIATASKSAHPIPSAFASDGYECADPDEFVSLTRSGHVEIIDTKPIGFQASIARVTLGRLWLQCGAATTPLLARISPPMDRVCLNFLVPGSTPALRQTTVVSDHDISFYGTTQPSSLRYLGRTEWAGASLPVNDYIEAGRTLLGKDVEVCPHFHVLRPRQRVMGHLQRMHKTVTSLARTNPEAFATSETVRAFEIQFVEAVFAAISASSPRSTDSLARHTQVIAKFQGVLDAAPETALYVTDICISIGVAARTLRHIFEKYLGISPHQYLSERRLHLARSALLLATSGSTTVTDIATQFGFWELGRFAVNYRLRFGESPIATLRADPNRFSIRQYQFPPFRPSLRSSHRQGINIPLIRSL
jgi:AraC-like DNA-binding protein